jgi:hypothetical protein
LRSLQFYPSLQKFSYRSFIAATLAANTMIPLHAKSQGIHSMWLEPLPIADRTSPLDAAVMSATENRRE